ncbi:MAG: class I SAM-dependent methyltransferase [Pseudonocardiaceae bacterium]
MSWGHQPPYSTATAFYDALATLVRDMSAATQRRNPILMEVGFGVGRLLHEMCEGNPHAIVIGIEESAEMTEVARAILAGVSPSTANKVTLCLGDIQKLPEFPQAADFVLCVNVLDRAEKTSDAIANLAKATRDNGKLLVVTALDYESTITPSWEQLDSEAVVREFETAGCTPERSFWTQLEKFTTSGRGRVYDELVLILRKRG